MFTSQVFQFVLPLPPAEEQDEIVRRIQLHMAGIRQLNDFVAESATDAGSLDQSILAQAFRGELVEQDLTDEPASVLLERIRAERATAAPRRRARRKESP